MGEISAYPWAAHDFARGQRANCSLVVLQQTMGNQFPCASIFLCLVHEKVTPSSQDMVKLQALSCQL